MLAAAKNAELDVLFLGGADEINTNELASTFVVYVGTHGDAGAHRADVILPSAAYTEKSVTYVNTEGRAQMTTRAAFPPGDAKEDWAILRALSEALGVTQGWDSMDELRQTMYAIAPHLPLLISFFPPMPQPFLNWVVARARFHPTYSRHGKRFYMTNPIARASRTMAECSAVKNGRKLQAAE